VEISPSNAARRARDTDVIGWGEADGAGLARVMGWRMTEFHRNDKGASGDTFHYLIGWAKRCAVSSDQTPSATSKTDSSNAQAVIDDFQALVREAPAPDHAAATRERAAFDGIGVLADLAAWRASWVVDGAIRRPILVLFAATYPDQKEGAAESRRSLEQLAQGVGPTNRLARKLGSGVEAFDLAIDRPVRDAAFTPAMTLRETAATLAFGMEAIAKTPDVLLLSDLSMASERAAAALILGLTGVDWRSQVPELDSWKERALTRAANASPPTPIDWLSELGGREIAALVGAIIAARASGTPVIIDGVAALAAALVAHSIHPRAAEHVLCASAKDDFVCQTALLQLGLAPVLQERNGESRGVLGLGVLGLLRTIEISADEA